MWRSVRKRSDDESFLTLSIPDSLFYLMPIHFSRLRYFSPARITNLLLRVYLCEFSFAILIFDFDLGIRHNKGIERKRFFLDYAKLIDLYWCTFKHIQNIFPHFLEFLLWAIKVFEKNGCSFVIFFKCKSRLRAGFSTDTALEEPGHEFFYI